MSNMLRRSLVRFAGSHVYLGKFHDFCQWEVVPPKKLKSVISPIKDILSHSKRNMLVPGVPKKNSGLVLRGSGLHGPENTEVFRLCLWNRLKQRRPQREVPTLKEMREWNKLEISCVWFTWGYLLFYWPMGLYGAHYATKHDHFPWIPARTDGSRGEGPTFWYLE